MQPPNKKSFIGKLNSKPPEQRTNYTYTWMSTKFVSWFGIFQKHECLTRHLFGAQRTLEWGS